MYTTLEDIKKHLNIDESFHDDDAYLTSLYEVAESVVARNICCVLSDLQDETGAIPAPLRHAILLYIGDLYNNRESIAYGGNPVEVPFSYQFLIDLYMNYADTTSEDFVQHAIDNIAKQAYIDKNGDLQINAKRI